MQTGVDPNAHRQLSQSRRQANVSSVRPVEKQCEAVKEGLGDACCSVVVP
jgi:hypothetical protein